MNEIPKNLDEAIQIICHQLKDDLENISRTPINEYVNTEHFGLGRFLRNEWKLNSGSELQTWFKDNGVEYPDDMSKIILTSFHRQINNIPINLEEQIKSYRIYWNIRNSEK